MVECDVKGKGESRDPTRRLRCAGWEHIDAWNVLIVQQQIPRRIDRLAADISDVNAEVRSNGRSRRELQHFAIVDRGVVVRDIQIVSSIECESFRCAVDVYRDGRRGVTRGIFEQRSSAA